MYKLCFNDGTGSVTSCGDGVAATADTRSPPTGTTTWSRTADHRATTPLATASSARAPRPCSVYEPQTRPATPVPPMRWQAQPSRWTPSHRASPAAAAGAVAINAAITVTAYDANATNNGGDSETADDGVTYTLGGINAGEFNIVAESGIVTYKSVQAVVTTAPHHRIVITATDTAGNPTTHDVTIEVLDVPGGDHYQQRHQRIHQRRRSPSPSDSARRSPTLRRPATSPRQAACGGVISPELSMRR